MNYFIAILTSLAISLSAYIAYDHYGETITYRMDCAAVHANSGEEYLEIVITDYTNVPIWADVVINTRSNTYEARLEDGYFSLENGRTSSGVFIAKGEDLNIKFQQLRREDDHWRAVAFVYKPLERYEIFSLYCTHSDNPEDKVVGKWTKLV